MINGQITRNIGSLRKIGGPLCLVQFHTGKVGHSGLSATPRIPRLGVDLEQLSRSEREKFRVLVDHAEKALGAAQTSCARGALSGHGTCVNVLDMVFLPNQQPVFAWFRDGNDQGIVDRLVDDIFQVWCTNTCGVWMLSSSGSHHNTPELSDAVECILPSVVFALPPFASTPILTTKFVRHYLATLLDVVGCLSRKFSFFNSLCEVESSSTGSVPTTTSQSTLLAGLAHRKHLALNGQFGVSVLGEITLFGQLFSREKTDKEFFSTLSSGVPRAVCALLFRPHGRMEADELLRQIHALLTSAGLVHLPRKSWHHGGARFTGPVYKSIFSATSGCSLDFAGMPPRQFADTLVALQMLIQGLQLEKCSSSMTVDMVGARNLLLSFGLEMYMHPESITESYLPPLEAMVFSTTTTDETVIFLLDHSDDHPRLSWEVLCTSFLFPKATPIIVCRPHVLDETSIVGEVETVEHGVCFSVPCEPAAVEAFHQFKTNKSVRRVYGTVRNGLCTAVSDSYPVLF